MIKRTSRNFKVPLVYGGQWKDHQSFQKWDPISKRLITVNCCLPQKCFEPEPVTNVTLSSMVSGSAVVSWTGPSNVSFEVNIYEGVSEPVDTSGTPIYSVLGGTSGSTFYFSNTSAYYYVASVRVRNNCLFSGYAYSNSVQYIFTGYSFTKVTFTGGAPNNGEMWLDIYSSPSATLGISIFDNLSSDVTSWLYGTVATSTYIKLQKDLSNYIILQRNANGDNGTFWTYDCTILSSSGTLNDGDTITITTT
jgi:hypothetical protein